MVTGEIPAPGNDDRVQGHLLSVRNDGLHETKTASSRVSISDLEEGARRLTLARQLVALIESGSTQTAAAARLELCGAAASRLLARWRMGGRTAAAFAPGHSTGRPRALATAAADRAALAAQYLVTNRTATAGSAQEAARMVRRKGLVSPELIAEINRREQAGLPLLPESLAAEIIAAPAVVQAHRNPTEAAYQYINTVGTMRWITDPVTGHERLARAGDVWEADDGTINLVVCIPWDAVAGCPVSERYGVKIGRFQWLPMIDVGTSYILGYSYTARPKSSYRAEDVLALMRAMFAAHGVPRCLRYERGTWEANRIQSAMDRLGIARWTAYSPHQKLIENLFNTLWTKLSDLPGQVGRFRGEEEEANRLLESCRTGAQDPRKHFPMLSDVLAAFDRVIAEKNATRISSDVYGDWIPSERWALQRDEGRLQPLPEDAAWLFAPCVRELTVRNGNLSTKVAVTDDWSVQFDYQGAFLPLIDGAKVSLHFDPFGPDATGTVVLLQDLRDLRAGQVMGQVTQVNKVAAYARRSLGWGDDIDRGKQTARDTKNSLHQTIKAILPNGRPSITTTTVQDGQGNAVRLSTGESVPAVPAGNAGVPPAPCAPAVPAQRASSVIPDASDPLALATGDEWSRTRARSARLAAARKSLAEEISV